MPRPRRPRADRGGPPRSPASHPAGPQAIVKGLWPWSRRSQAIDDAAWAAMLDQLPGLAWLTPEQGRVLRQRAAELLSRKPIHAAPGLTLAPAMQLRIALLAALPAPGLGLAAARTVPPFFAHPA